MVPAGDLPQLDPTWLSTAFPELGNLRAIGSGGQRWVYEAIHPVDGSIVLKVVKPGQEPERIRREINAVSTIRSAHVPQIYGTGVAASSLGPCVWLREKRIDGTSLAVVISRGALSRNELLTLIENLLTALGDAERVRIVHRDVKPGNVIRESSGSYWLLDFGLARDLNLQSLTPTAAPFGVGTVGYSAPEQMRNLKPRIDSRADLFAAGVTIYEAATGTNPFRAGARDNLEVLRRTERMPLPRMRLSFDPAGSLADMVSAMTQKYPDQRPRTVTETLSWFRQIVPELA